MDGLRYLSLEKYDMSTGEKILAAALKAYLVGLEDDAAREMLSEIVNPRVIRIGSYGSDRNCNHRSVPMPLQSTVEGAKLAALIDRAVAAMMGLVRNGRMGRSESRAVVVAELERIDGKTSVESMSTELLQFVVDCYRAVRY